MGAFKFYEFYISWVNIKIQFFWYIYFYLDSVSYSFGYYWATSLRTYSPLPRTIWFTMSNKNRYVFLDLSAAKVIRTKAFGFFLLINNLIFMSEGLGKLIILFLLYLLCSLPLPSLPHEILFYQCFFCNFSTTKNLKLRPANYNRNSKIDMFFFTILYTSLKLKILYSAKPRLIFKNIETQEFVNFN